MTMFEKWFACILWKSSSDYVV